MSDWINVEHHLPPKRDNYLCVLVTLGNRKFYFRGICHYNGNGEWTEENRGAKSCLLDAVTGIAQGGLK